MSQVATDLDTRRLPTGWKWENLGNVIAEIQVGFACGKRENSGLVQLRMNNVTTEGSYDWQTITRIPSPVTDLEKYSLRTNDVLFNNTNSVELVGKSALFQDFPEPVVFSNHFTRLRTNPTVLDARILALWLLKEWESGTFARMCNRWVGQAAVQRKSLLDMRLPLPPLPEQKRIAAILDEQLAAVEKAKKAAEERLEAARALPAAYLREVFDGEEARKWPAMSVTELLDSGQLILHKDGNHGSNYPRKDEFVDEGVKFIVAKDITSSGGLNLSGAACLKPERAAGLRIGWARGGDVLLAHNATVGPVGRVPEGIEEFVVGTSLTIYRCAPAMLHKYFLYYSLQSSFFQSQLLAKMGQTTRNQVPITAQKELTLRIAPLERQPSLVAQLEDQIDGSKLVEESIQQETAIIEAMPAALLRRAFSGEL